MQTIVREKTLYVSFPHFYPSDDIFSQGTATLTQSRLYVRVERHNTKEVDGWPKSV